ncbi:MAG: GNAT family N-acetyltransferase [Candidatus Sumerlaeaceae bacterium]|nr:GNAT family N-acetyltransferase [Candidatus Sumerlaeaceae bacterium]
MTAPRPLRADELDLLGALFDNAYRVGLETGRSWARAIPPEETIAFVEGGRVASVVRMIPYEAYFGGRVLRLGGIGGVATWLDLQGRGYAGELMHRSVAIMRERGDAVSALYPFSVRYYRKFGWAHAGDRMLYLDVHQQQLVAYEERRLVRHCEGEREIPLLGEVYSAFAARYNGMLVRTEEMWRGHLRALSGCAGHAYIIEEDGRPTGYFFCEHKSLDTPGAHEALTRDFACTTPAAWRAMMGTLAVLPLNVHRLVIGAPVVPLLTEHFREPSQTARLHPVFMFRVVDLVRAVAGRGYDAQVRGAVRLSVHDAHGPWNSGVWEIEFADGQGEARPAPPGATPDAELTIQEFSELFIGYANPAALRRHGLFAKMSDQTAVLLSAAFCDRVPALADAF